jgi:hypothetical protein
MRKQLLLIELVGLLAFAAVPQALAQNGFYGGGRCASTARSRPALCSAMNRWPEPLQRAHGDDNRSARCRALPLKNDVAVEAAFTADQYALPVLPALPAPSRPGAERNRRAIVECGRDELE